MKSHVKLLGWILRDCSIRCCTSTSLDFNTVQARVEHEGLSFLTITLPDFGSEFEIALDQGMVDPTFFKSFKKKASLPAFLWGLTSQVFDSSSGTLLDTPSIEAIRCVRQICNLFKRLLHPCSDIRMQASFDAYVECEQSVRLSDSSLEIDRKFDFMRVADLLFQKRLFQVIDREVELGSPIPKHGPGATADRLKANAKYDNRTWTNRLEELFPAGEFLFTSPRHYFNSLEDGVGPIWLEPEAEIPVRVISVPKTLKTPRIIAIEPTYAQYVQQALMTMIVNGIERNDTLSSIIGFKDQTVNRDYACIGSKDGDLATLDLSEASDRVSNLHVNLLLGRNPFLAEAVQACRSSKADVPGYGVIPLAKFASMGSALTFPLEAMVFATIIFLGIERELNVPLNKQIVKDLLGKVRVYGDDIIVPVRYVHSVIRELEAFGLRVNGRKSFWTGKFRESCGGDFYDGFNVNYVKCRRDLPTKRNHVQEIISAVSLRNQLHLATGFDLTVQKLDELIERLIPFPKVHPDSPCLGKHTHDFEQLDVDRMCKNLQRPLVRGMKVSSLLPKSNLEGHGALLKFFLGGGSMQGDFPWMFEPSTDRNHLERAGRPDAVNIKLGYWSNR